MASPVIDWTRFGSLPLLSAQFLVVIAAYRFRPEHNHSANQRSGSELVLISLQTFELASTLANSEGFVVRIATAIPTIFSQNLKNFYALRQMGLEQIKQTMSSSAITAQFHEQ
jgi:hypothetical protein